MNQTNKKRRIRSILRWVMWVVMIQFLLFNVSAILYGYKLTYFYEAASRNPVASKNIFIKTWRLFSGPRFEKSVIDEVPHFDYQTINLKTKNNINLEAWYIPCDSGKGTVILVHGLGQNKSMLLKEAYEFLYWGFNVMLLDLRAHGNSAGNVSTMGFNESEDLKLAYDYVSKRGEKNIILYGVSLGATVIAKTIHDYDISPSRAILEIPFESVKSLFDKRLRMLGFPEEPFGSVTTFWAGIERRFNGFAEFTSKFARSVKCPVLLQYAAHDQIVSVKETNSIFDNIASRDKRLVEYANADHGFLLDKDPEKWRNEIGGFLLGKDHFRMVTLAPTGK